MNLYELQQIVSDKEEEFQWAASKISNNYNGIVRNIPKWGWEKLVLQTTP